MHFLSFIFDNILYMFQTEMEVPSSPRQQLVYMNGRYIPNAAHNIAS